MSKNYKLCVTILLIFYFRSENTPFNPAKSMINHMKGNSWKDSKPNVAKDNRKNSDESKWEFEDERYKGLDPQLVEKIEGDILQKSPSVTWNEIAGLDFAKKTIKEIIILPLMRPDIFKGIRTPSKGVLLFGPPGTGKTMIGKAIATESKSTFFSISASTLTSKWVGEGEKMVRTLFALAAIHQPSVVFIDEIDSLLWARSENDQEGSRRLKTEFMVQFGGTRSDQEDRVLIIGATNRPEELDDAIRRRLEKRLYIPLPNSEGRKVYISNIIEMERTEGIQINMNDQEIDEIVALTKGYSGADLKSLWTEAAMVPVRSVIDKISTINADSIRGVNINDFK